MGKTDTEIQIRQVTTQHSDKQNLYIICQALYAFHNMLLQDTAAYITDQGQQSQDASTIPYSSFDT